MHRSIKYNLQFVVRISYTFNSNSVSLNCISNTEFYCCCYPICKGRRPRPRRLFYICGNIIWCTYSAGASSSIGIGSWNPQREVFSATSWKKLVQERWILFVLKWNINGCVINSREVNPPTHEQSHPFGPINVRMVVDGRPILLIYNGFTTQCNGFGCMQLKIARQ